MEAPAIHLDRVAKHFKVSGSETVKAVDELSLDIARGEIVAFLGPNGAGKTTTLDLILGLSEATSGTVQTLGMRPDAAVKQGRVSAVLQDGGLLGDLTVGETVRMIAGVYESSLAPEEAMERAGIRRLEKRRVSKCSGGEQQRLRFALALLPEPDLLILDEPTAGMDVNARQEFWDTMRREASEGRTFVFATHYLQEANDFANRVVLIANGKLVADGAVDEIRSISGARHVSLRWPDADLDALRSLPGVTAVEQSGERIRLTASESDDVARYLLTATPAVDLEITQPSLDQAFTRLTTSTGAAS